MTSKPRRGACVRSALLLVCSALAVACGSPPAAAVPEASLGPDAGRAAPDEPSAHGRALERMLSKRWGRQSDRDNQLQVPLPDPKRWKRVRFSLIDHFVGFRSGKGPDAFAVVLAQPTPAGEATTSASCLRRAEQAARPMLEAFDVQMGDITRREIEWKHQRVIVHETSGAVDYGFGPRSFAVAWAAYPAYADGCLVYGLAIPWEGERELAEQVRERWITEGLRRMKPLTEQLPSRK